MIKPRNTNSESELGGINHVAVVSSGLARTLDCYGSERQVSATPHPGIYMRSFYFQDPDGITLEFSCWTKDFTTRDVQALPRTAAGRRVPAAAR
ncbi:MAG: VOC family protein [Mycobacterium sp.]|nr:VOC family protein [Mycobacterium sp.]